MSRMQNRAPFFEADVRLSLMSPSWSSFSLNLCGNQPVRRVHDNSSLSHFSGMTLLNCPFYGRPRLTGRSCRGGDAFSGVIPDDAAGLRELSSDYSGDKAPSQDRATEARVLRRPLVGV